MAYRYAKHIWFKKQENIIENDDIKHISDIKHNNIIVEFPLDPNNHEHLVTEIIKKPTCISKGKGVKVCDCGYKEEFKIDIDKNMHKYGLINIIKPTCTEDGKEIYECKYCEEQMSVLIPALGHKYKSVEVKPATCIKPGYKIEECNQCGDRKTITLPKLEHFYQTVFYENDPELCRRSVCVRCGEEINVYYHRFEKGDTCKVCGYKRK